jgi:hypothetical protein
MDITDTVGAILICCSVTLGGILLFLGIVEWIGRDDRRFPFRYRR